MRGTPIAAYTAPDGEKRLLCLLLLGDAGSAGLRLPAALLAARLRQRPALLLDVRAERTGDERVIGEHAAGEGLAAVHALAADYRARAERATKPIARRLTAEDLLGGLAEEEAA